MILADVLAKIELGPLRRHKVVRAPPLWEYGFRKRRLVSCSGRKRADPRKITEKRFVSVI